MRRIPIVYIQWVDAHGNTGWFSIPEMENWTQSDWYTDSVGFIVKETEKMIILAERHEPTGHANGEEQWGGLHKIPKTWIRNRRLLGYLKHDGIFIKHA